ncbi:MAG TPA: hypothetical protein VGQ53_21395 [Chitinophagaceae bacterium]|jgi:hypothetical protein|nr:hypothetical protein [Chitinophagaceae bacterium]
MKDEGTKNICPETKDPAEKNDLEVWKHFGSTGGSDKNSMIQIVTWLLSLSTAIIGLYATNKFGNRSAINILFIVGALVSALAAYIALLYGAYSLRNWAIADRIAEQNHWEKQLPGYNPFEEVKLGRWTKRVSRLGKPCKDEVALVFWIFFGVCIISMLAHLGLLAFHPGIGGGTNQTY